MSNDRMELVATLYILCSDYHSGQSSRGYRILSRIVTRYREVRITDSWAEEIRESPLYNELAFKYGDKL